MVVPHIGISRVRVREQVQGQVASSVGYPR